MKTIDMKRRSNIDVFFVLCVFLICALLLLGMLFVGADTQQKINRSTEDNFYMRTGLLYPELFISFLYKCGAPHSITIIAI